MSQICGLQQQQINSNRVEFI
ncbi:unnamed protein product, partial [Rotaria sp. Silwood1]